MRANLVPELQFGIGQGFAHLARVAAIDGRYRMMSHREAPPSVLPDISPSRGEIGSFGDGACPSISAIGESRGDVQSPPLRGRCPAGQRGVPGANLSTPAI
ncbi:hypothetical protein MPLB_1740072 [Mesorhizobium sp. ORS 3324]|nr:hypothetical protein MPLB_1740072 [Mesorhizobium sp. ORS 3324]